MLPFYSLYNSLNYPCSLINLLHFLHTYLSRHTKLKMNIFNEHNQIRTNLELDRFYKQLTHRKLFCFLILRNDELFKHVITSLWSVSQPWLLEDVYTSTFRIPQLTEVHTFLSCQGCETLLMYCFDIISIWMN